MANYKKSTVLTSTKQRTTEAAPANAFKLGKKKYFKDSSLEEKKKRDENCLADRYFHYLIYVSTSSCL